APDGMIVFDHQPVDRRIETMKRVFQDRGLDSFRQSVVLLSSKWSDDDLLVSPSGFSRAEILRLVAASGGEPRRVLLAPNFPARSESYDRIVGGPVAEREVMTDDRPFLVGLDWGHYTLFPSETYLSNYHR